MSGTTQIVWLPAWKSAGMILHDRSAAEAAPSVLQ